ncbi:acetylglutamate kinase [Halobacillus andaensis]|uniref:Acetylglutamate kinase n=1 Tax=Halobacillus andaensis TaxID=1176239 RepID=A0A917EVE5_HALAA|nr:acetylglutamate kinase [Halobacillus andaensis]MBP2004631.1 acetylglutamate kinase [Halobacillus andaensis]GGF20168.1 acetylglutamate kinase [Halobacillus andaensis]
MTMSKSMQATERNHKPVLVIKLGGSMIDKISESFYKSFCELTKHYQCVVVHGGGPAITSLLEDLNIKGEFFEGLRKTTAETLEVVTMTLGGTVSAQVTSAFTKQGVPCVGLKGSDGGLLKARFINKEKLGFVGDIEEVNVSLIQQIIQQNYIPVIAPLATTAEGQMVNVNADVAAAAVASALKAEKLLFVTDVPGILNQGEVIPQTTPEEIQQLIADDVIYGGMIPKVKSAVNALSEHLHEVLIVSGEQSLVQGNVIKGTTIYQDVKEGVVK